MLQEVLKKPILLDSDFFYFFKLNEKNLKNFERKWRLLETHDAKDSKSLANIMHKSAKHLKRDKQQNTPGYKQAVEFLTKHVNFWEDQALAWMKQGGFNSQELASSLWAYATLGIEPSAEFMAVWEEEALAQMKRGEFNSQSLANSLWAYATLGIEPSAEFIAVWEEEALARMKRDAFKSQDLASSLNQDEFDSQNLDNSLWAVSVIDSFSNSQDLKELYSAIRVNISDQSLINCPEAQRQVRDSDLWFTGKSKVLNPEREGTVSGFERKVGTLFKDAGYSIKGEAPNCLKAFFGESIDFPVSRGGETILVEVDGPDHYVRNWKTGLVRHNGATLFQSALMQKFAPEDIILRIGYEQVDPVLELDPDDSLRTAFCDNVFHHFSTQQPGAYGLKSQNGIVYSLERKRPLRSLAIA